MVSGMVVLIPLGVVVSGTRVHGRMEPSECTTGIAHLIAFPCGTRVTSWAEPLAKTRSRSCIKNKLRWDSGTFDAKASLCEHTLEEFARLPRSTTLLQNLDIDQIIFLGVERQVGMLVSETMSLDRTIVGYTYDDINGGGMMSGLRWLPAYGATEYMGSIRIQGGDAELIAAVKRMHQFDLVFRGTRNDPLVSNFKK